ncbi:hypothetical protein acdb102_31390 [Acidothermaceae bacterium B102]|nr:hypothetical protein acdb102_31390 [Acidothermaceae bacterium B102]
MARIDNPAGRLHALLTSYEAEQVAQSNRTFLVLWSAALQINPDLVPKYMCEVIGLIPAIEMALAGQEQEEEQRAAFSHYLPHWIDATMAPANNWNSGPGAPIDKGALIGLGSMSAYLSAVAPEGEPPSQDRIDAWLQETASLMSDIDDSNEVSDDLRRVLHSHLEAVSWALRAVRVSGAAGIVAASERLMGAVAVSVATTEPAAPTRKCFDFGRRLYSSIISTGAGIQAIETIVQVQRMITG